VQPKRLTNRAVAQTVSAQSDDFSAKLVFVEMGKISDG
jgi:hypothetical protein